MERCEMLFEYFKDGYSKFASVDIRGDRKVMDRTWGFKIPYKLQVDIQNIYYIPGEGRDGRSGMGALAADLIDPSYYEMKYEFPEEGHKCLAKQPLDEVNLKYADVDGYVSFEVYCRL